MGEHREETGIHKSLEESILEKIDAAAATAEEPAKEAVKTANQTRLVVRALVILIVVFAISTSLAVVRSQQAINRIEKVAKNNAAYVQAGCVDGNKSRLQEYNVIFGILKDSFKGPRGQSPEAKAVLNSYKLQLQEAYPMIDCTQVVAGKRIIVPYK